MEEENKKIMNMLLFVIGFMVIISIAGQLAPPIENFFKNSPSLAEFTANNRWPIVIVMAVLLSSFNTLFYKFGIDKSVLEQMKKAKEEQKELQKKIKEVKNDPQKAAVLQKEMLGKSMGAATNNFRIMFSTKAILMNYLPSITILFLIIGPLYRAADIGFFIPLIDYITLPIYGKVGGGIFWVIILSMFFHPILKKIFKSEV